MSLLTVAEGGLVIVTVIPAGANHWFCISTVEVLAMVLDADAAASGLVMTRLTSTLTLPGVMMSTTSSASGNLASSAARKASALNEATSPAS